MEEVPWLQPQQRQQLPPCVLACHNPEAVKVGGQAGLIRIKGMGCDSGSKGVHEGCRGPPWRGVDDQDRNHRAEQTHAPNQEGQPRTEGEDPTDWLPVHQFGDGDGRYLAADEVVEEDK